MENQIDEVTLNEIIEYLKDKSLDNICRDFEYDKKVYELLYSLGIDENYSDNHSQIEDKDIEEMDLDNIKTMYTFICRGERFCTGHIAGNIADGTLLKLAKRQLELIKHEQISK